MANTIVQRTLVGAGADKTIVRMIHVISDGSEETDLVVYDNSALVNDVTKGTLMGFSCMGSDCLIRLEWDQTADSPITSFSPINNPKMNFKKFGGIGNPGGTGATGDIVMTTAGLDPGDEFMLILWIHQN